MASSTSPSTITTTTAAAAVAAPSNTESKKFLWDDEAFASRYRKAETFTGEHARDLLQQMGLNGSTATPVHFLDLACGTGVVAKLAISVLGLDEKHDESTVATHNVAGSNTENETRYYFTAADLAPAMLDVLRSRIETEHWPVQPKVIQVDMRDTKLPADSFTHLACNFGPCNAPTPLVTLRESYRLIRPGGVAGWTAWMSCGWYPDLQAAIHEIRSAARKACADGDGDDDDDDEEKKLAKIPELLSFEVMIGKFAGISDLSTARDEDGEIPKWQDDGYFVRQVQKAGFVDVQVSAVTKRMEMSIEEAVDSMKPIVKIIGTWWSDEEKKVLEGGLLEGRVKEWYQRRAERSGSDKVVWDDWKAMLVTGKKQ